ncbi:ferredoxin [Dactylosporangium sp. CA-052675]|uniref:ferredoxin n=1 Tax=Dactylosporangium sp. CA-052675 TaxID=3239927 RepID=UPI003D906367
MSAVHVSVDQASCISSGQCVLTAGDVFDQREEDGVVTLLTDAPPPSLAADVRHAALLCPARAITVDESPDPPSA